MVAFDDENLVEGIAQNARGDKPREAGADHDRALSVQKPDSESDPRGAESPPRLTMRLLGHEERPWQRASIESIQIDWSVDARNVPRG